jgi:hypothetical protein
MNMKMGGGDRIIKAGSFPKEGVPAKEWMGYLNFQISFNCVHDHVDPFGGIKSITSERVKLDDSIGVISLPNRLLTNPPTNTLHRIQCM